MRELICTRCGQILDTCICAGQPFTEEDTVPLGYLEPWSSDWQMGFKMGPEYTLSLDAPPAFWRKKDRDQWVEGVRALPYGMVRAYTARSGSRQIDKETFA
jgi:hypothetical protein